MIRSLASKLTLAFLLVGLAGAVLVAIFVRQRTQQEFDKFILNQNQQALVSNLIEYYQENGSWNGINNVFTTGRGELFSNLYGGPHGDIHRTSFTLADANGTIILAGGLERPGQQVPQENLNRDVPLEVNGETVGWMIFNQVPERFTPGTPEGNFLTSLNQATIFSAMGAAGIALILGGILAYTLTRSLRELTSATQILARGKLGHKVKVRSRDELGILAESFNQMSAELAHANDLRRRMTADIAHDLRTPLSVILGYTEALSDGKLQASPEMYSVMHTEAQRLNHLIDDLKTISLADAGELPLMPQPIDPGEFLRRTALAHQVKAQKENIAIEMDTAADLPMVKVDVERMAQVLGNLVSNALRYTPPGGEIRLSAQRENGGLDLQVSDNGAGIPPEDLPHLFERAFQRDKSRQQLSGESGLGLAIAKSLVQAHEGTISVESTLGKGTSFRIHLPVSE